MFACWAGGQGVDGDWMPLPARSTEFREHTISGQKYKPVPGDDSYCIKVTLSKYKSHLYIVLPAS